jgi:hypothetical protein
MKPENALDTPERVSELVVGRGECETVLPRLKDFKKLEILRIKDADFDQFPTIVYDLIGLQQLDLVGGRVGQFPIGIAKMKELRWITLSWGAITVLPTDLGKLPALRILELDGTGLTAFSVGKGDYAALEKLALKSCQLSALPDDLGRLPRLRSLAVSGNPLTQLPSSLANAKKLQFLRAQDCRLESIPDDVFSLPELVKIDLTGNTFPADDYKTLERLAKSHRKIEVLMPRSGAKKSAPGGAISNESLAKSIQKDLDRLGAKADESVEPIREAKIAETTWPVPSALGELLGRIGSPRKILAPVNDDPEPVDLAHDSGALDEYECIHHHPYVLIADTQHHVYVVVRLDDKKPADPMLYTIDSEDYSEQEASKLGRLSDWLKAARPVDGKPRAVRSSLNQVAGRRER